MQKLSCAAMRADIPKGLAPMRQPPQDIAEPGPAPRHVAVLSLIVALPFVSGLIMLDPDRAMILGLANLTIMALPLAMLMAWPEVRRGIWPGGRIAALTALVLGYALLLAVVRAPHTGFSLMALQFWPGALIAGRAIQLGIRTHGASVAHAALVALLCAGPLYVTLLPLMEVIYGAQGNIDWARDMPGFNHVRKMGHLLTLSAAAGLGTMAFWPRTGVRRPVATAILLLAVVALALALWSGARGAWLALIVGAVLTGLGARAYGHPLHLRRLAVLVPLAIGLALLLPGPGNLLGLLDELQSSATRIGNLNDLSSDRLAIWAETLDLIAAAPLQGYGWGQFLLVQRQYPFPQVHDLPLELLLGLGIPMGLLGLSVMITLWIQACMRAARAGYPAMLGALCVLNTMAIYALVSGTYYYGVPVVLTGLAWGICLSGRPRDPAASG